MVLVAAAVVVAVPTVVAAEAVPLPAVAVGPIGSEQAHPMFEPGALETAGLAVETVARCQPTP